MGIKKILILFFCVLNLYSFNSIENFIHNKKLNILCKDSSRQIYQIKSRSYLDGYTCGFFVLHNNINLESFLGLNNICEIKQKCSQYINSKKINPTSSLSTVDLLYLADNTLSLKNFYILNLASPNQIKLQLHSVNWSTQFSTRYKKVSIDVTLLEKDRAQAKVTAPYNTGQDAIKIMVTDAVINKLKEKLEGLKNILRTNSTVIINFACVISSENHYILASVVKLQNQNPALFIFDNLNLKYNCNQERTNIINNIYNMFCV